MSFSTEDGALWPREQLERSGGGGQLHAWDMMVTLARKAHESAANTLAGRIGRPPMYRQDTARGDLPLSPQYAMDVAHAALTAEGVVKVAQDLDNLSVRVAALEAAGKDR